MVYILKLRKILISITHYCTKLVFAGKSMKFLTQQVYSLFLFPKLDCYRRNSYNTITHLQ
jgi:hypothetical protein